MPKTNISHKEATTNNLEHILYTVLHDAPESRWKAADVEWLNGAIEMLRYRVGSALPSEKAILLQALLVVQTPRAARAQAQMDAHEHGYHNREKRLFELIDFRKQQRTKKSNSLALVIAQDLCLKQSCEFKYKNHSLNTVKSVVLSFILKCLL